nr:hypothetical protein [Kofleriaceae bacterium]
MPVDGGPVADAIAFTKGLSTLAGASDAGNVDGDRAHARFNDPVNVIVGPDGTVYVADFNNGEIRAIDQDGNVTTALNKHGFARPYGMVWAPDGTLYVETDNDKNANHSLMSGSVWKVDLAQHTAICIANAIGRPRGMVVLGDGRIAMADELHHVIEALDPTTGQLTTLAGTWDQAGYADATGAAARFNTPYGMALRGDGKLVVVDQANNRLRLVGLDGTTQTLAGIGVGGYADGSMTEAEFHVPQAIAITKSGDLYVTDDDNFRVRKVTTEGVVTIAGNGTGGYKDADDPTQGEIYGLEGLAFNDDESLLYVTDGSRGDNVPFNRVRFLMLGAAQ